MTDQAETIDTSVPGLPGYVVLRRLPGENAFWGYIERSWNMDYSPERVRFWWSGTGHSIIGQMKVDGLKDAEHNATYVRKNFPDAEVLVMSVDDPNLPIVIDWPRWHKERERKFEDRNPAFTMKGDQ